MGKTLTVRGARENNLKSVNVDFPLGTLIAIPVAGEWPSSNTWAGLAIVAAGIAFANAPGRLAHGGGRYGQAATAAHAGGQARRGE